MNAQNTFLVTYKNGKKVTDTVDATDFPDAETFCMKRYGLDLAAAKEYGTTVEQVDATTPAEEPKEPAKAEVKAEAKVDVAAAAAAADPKAKK